MTAERYLVAYPLAVPLFGVPVPGRSNPYLAAVAPEARVSVGVEVYAAESASSLRLKGLGLGWRLELALKSFLDTLAARLEQPLDAVLEASVPGYEYPPPVAVYAAATLALVEAVSVQAGYSLSKEEVLEAASSIDREAATWLDYIDAVREAMVRGVSLVYREGEGAVPLEAGGRLGLVLVGEEDIGEDYSQRLGDPVVSAVTRLGGVSVLDAVTKLREAREPPTDVLLEAARVDNALFYLLYGAQPPEEGCKWTPSLQRVYGVCLPGRAPGERAEFML